ncbi:MAG: exodeoxyribonuclease [Solirubrobacteraceae bacterium]|nr:exodeoxyribonuclease [Solirubrobacteraceae bacterium]
MLTWNVAGRLTRLDEQAGRVLGHRPDVVCLQEVIPNALGGWMSRLGDAGYAVAASAVAPDAARVHRLGVLVASRHPLAPVAAATAAVPWPERMLAADVRPPGWSQALRVVCLHAPLSQRPELVKVRTLEAVHASLAALGDELPAVLCGDLNTPQYEARDGTIQTFAQTRTGRLRAERGERHDRAERRIVTGPPGWRDAFRALHGYGARDRSWKAGRHPGYRLDHILVSPAVTPLACAYDHELRTDGLSDHSALWATIAPAAR